MNEIKYDKSQVIATWNGIEVFSISGKYGLHHPENDVSVPPIYDNIEWDKSSDFIMVTQGKKVGFLSAEDGQFIDFNDEDPCDPYMMAIPYEEYLKEEWPNWMINSESHSNESQFQK